MTSSGIQNPPQEEDMDGDIVDKEYEGIFTMGLCWCCLSPRSRLKSWTSWERPHSSMSWGKNMKINGEILRKTENVCSDSSQTNRGESPLLDPFNILCLSLA